MILNADLASGLAIADAVRITRAVNLGDTAYIHSDHLGTPQKMTDAGGSIVWDRVARPFGATHSESGSLATDLRFPGQLHDAESGLHYKYFRDYDPTLGRYIQSDPIGLQGGINTYGYALGNPTRYTDPRGQSVAAACLTGIVAEPGPFSELACAGYGIYRGIRLLSEMVDEDDLPQSKAETTEGDACEEEDYDDDFCEEQYKYESDECFRDWGGFKPKKGETNYMLSGCLSRAGYRLEWCRKHKGNMTGAPPRWSDRDVDGWPTIHDR